MKNIIEQAEILKIQVDRIEKKIDNLISVVQQIVNMNEGVGHKAILDRIIVQNSNPIGIFPITDIIC